MSKIEIRQLNADEIECRVQSVKETGCILLLYKDARCDMRILDEVFGVTGWQRSHEIINGNLFCTVEIFDSEKNIWIKKQDVGVESFTEKEKGQASDAFKRACFNVGIGRELYTAPFIWIPLSGDEITKNNNKVNLASRVKFHVKEITYNSKREIETLLIVDQNGIERFPNNKKTPAENKPQQQSQNKPVAQVPGELVLKTVKLCSSKEELKHLCDTDYKVFVGNKAFNATVNERFKELENEPTNV